MSGYLLLSITIFLHGINDLLISFSLVQYHIFREYLVERWSVHIPMTLGYFWNILMFPDMGDEPFHKIVFTQNGLSFYLSPDSIFADTPFDELPVFLLGLGPLPAELSKNPIHGQAWCWRVPPSCGTVAGPFPGFRSFNHPCPDRIQYHVPAYFEKMAVFLNED